MDDLAHALKLDPLAFRLKNLKDERLRAVLEAAAKQFGWGKAKPAPATASASPAARRRAATSPPAPRSRSTARPAGCRWCALVTAFECGAVVNPDHLKNQVEGRGDDGPRRGAVRGDRIRQRQDPQPALRRLPRAALRATCRPLETVLLDRKDLPSAGAGETPIVAVAPAVGNAIFAATGVRLRSLPMVPNGLKV